MNEFDKAISIEIESADPAKIDRETLIRWAREVRIMENARRDFVMVPRDCNRKPGAVK